MRTERRAGELLKERREAEQLSQGGRPKKTGDTVLPVSETLADLGISRKQSSDWQHLGEDSREFCYIRMVVWPVGNSSQLCRVCSAKAEVLNAVNKLLEDRVPLNRISAETGFSRAGLSRHHRNCEPLVLLRNNRDRAGSPSARMFTQSLDGSITLAYDPQD